MVQFFPALTPPPATAQHNISRIAFRHPAYSPAHTPLLELNALDRSDTGEMGVDYDFVLAACGIICGNVFETGYFAVKRGSMFERIQRPSDGVLTGPGYFFLQDGCDPAGMSDSVHISATSMHFAHPVCTKSNILLSRPLPTGASRTTTYQRHGAHWKSRRQ